MNHLLIIWSKASAHRDYIISDLKQRFLVRNMFKVHWDHEDFESNLRVFYAHSQKHLDEYAFHNLLTEKMIVCGTDDFYVVLFDDIAPNMVRRNTSSGVATVNVNVFDIKAKYRKLTGGGHRIHASNDEWETNKDLTVLFGKNLEDFCRDYPINDEYLQDHSSNCIGVGGFGSIQQLFYLLNNTASYCILRNFECLPNHYNLEGHGDIDLLVENKNYIKYLTQANDVFMLPTRVYHTIHIGNQDVPFDFRYIGDNYYDIEWEQQILNTRKLSAKGFYIPNEENQFYSLLYHVYVQKPYVAGDYLNKLSINADKAGISFNSTHSNAIQLLDLFFSRNNYDYVRPLDNTVYFNKTNLSESQRIKSYGWLVSKSIHDESYSVPFFSVVYRKNDSFYKRGSSFLIANEVCFLSRLSSYDHFPKIKATGVRDGDAYLEISCVPGKAFDSFFLSKRNNKPSMVHCFIIEVADMLRILVENDTLHRDLIPQNILIKGKGRSCHVSFIDFGWAVDISKKDDCLKPEGLADEYCLKKGYSDFYTLGRVIEKRWGYWVPYIKRVSSFMKSILWDDYRDVKQLLMRLDELDKLISRRFSLIDRIGLFICRHNSISKSWFDARHFIHEIKTHWSSGSRLRIKRLFHTIMDTYA